MSLKNWFYLFWTTLLIGAATSVLISIYLQITDESLRENYFAYLSFNAFVGMMFSILSQMGFFAYLTVNYIARTMIKKRLVWMTIQWLVTIIVFLDLIILRYVFFENNNAGISCYAILPIVLFVLSIGIAFWKSKLTNYTAFTPTVFFMFVATSLEAIPALRENNVDATLFMIVPLLVCNAWQILNLHRVIKAVSNESK